jgi:hypothetical protein
MSMTNTGKTLNSKDARKALRRWGFKTLVSYPDGNVGEKKLPGAFFGNYEEAQNVVKDLTSKFMDQNKDAKSIVVKPIAFETVSLETRQQLYALNNQATIVMQALYVMAEEFRVATKSDKNVDDLVHIAIQTAEDIRKDPSLLTQSFPEPVVQPASSIKPARSSFLTADDIRKAKEEKLSD